VTKKLSKPSATHVVYKTAEGIRVPGATTVIGLLAKPQLIIWANRLGLQGIDSSKYTDNLAGVGTLAHHIVLCRYKGDIPDTSDFSENQIDLAMNCMKSYDNWESGHTIKPLLTEFSLVSDSLLYGGTPDLYCEMDGIFTLLDFKTGKALYPEVMYQLAAYRNLLLDAGYPVDQCIALRIGREDSEGFEIKEGYNMDTAFVIFKHLLGLYHTIRKYEKEGR
jgi:hypothetical protein